MQDRECRQLTDRETQILERFREILPKLDARKQERILTLAEDAAILYTIDNATKAG